MLASLPPGKKGPIWQLAWVLYGSWLALLCYLLNPLFCKCAWGHRVVLEPFVGKVLLCLCASLAILIWVAISH